ncbi:MAG TPA: hypothetical protein VGA13_06820 [Acidimicrobiales bacterium]|jgi:hypothetical protein
MVPDDRRAQDFPDIRPDAVVRGQQRLSEGLPDDREIAAAIADWIRARRLVERL